MFRLETFRCFSSMSFRSGLWPELGARVQNEIRLQAYVFRAHLDTLLCIFSGIVRPMMCSAAPWDDDNNERWQLCIQPVSERGLTHAIWSRHDINTQHLDFFSCIHNIYLSPTGVRKHWHQPGAPGELLRHSYRQNTP